MPENKAQTHPILSPTARRHAADQFSENEIRLANRNSGIHLEMLRHDVTPIGMHYLLSHFDVPYIEDENSWALEVSGLVNKPDKFGMDALRQLPFVERTVTLECSGNGRALLRPRWPSMQWAYEAVSTARWGGAPLAALLDLVEPDARAEVLVFCGADSGVDGGKLHSFERALTMQQAHASEVMLVWQINGQPLPPQHGFPLRLIVPGWYGMASVKWLREIRFTDQPFEGYQQVNTYRYRESAQDPGTPVTDIRVKSLMVPPGIPDWMSRHRLLAAGEITLHGRAWSGAGRSVIKVEVAVEELDATQVDSAAAAVSEPAELEWRAAAIEPGKDVYAWSAWHCNWKAEPGHYRLRCRATDERGDMQPLVSRWDHAGFGNNVVQTVDVWVEKELPAAT